MAVSLAWVTVALLAFRADAFQLKDVRDIHPVFVQGEMTGLIAFSNVTRNNLGGMGPNRTDPKLIYFKGMGSSINGEKIDMTIMNTSEYTPGSDDAVAQNGRGLSGSNPFGFINVECGTFVNLVFAFTVNGVPAIIEFFDLTFSDIDSGNDEQQREYFGVSSPYEAVYLSNDSELRQLEMLPEGTKWMSTQPGFGDNNPKNPNFLTKDEKKRSVTLEFVNKSQISVIAGVSKPASGICNGARNFMFAFRSNMVPYVCNTCALASNGKMSCCAPGGSWSGMCGNAEMQVAGKTYYTFQNGLDICAMSPTMSPTPKPPATPSPTKPMDDIRTVSPTPSPTDPCGTCVIWGDPHVITFEAHKHRLEEHPQREEFFRTRGWKADQLTIDEAGIYWLVKSDTVHIQGKYVRNATAETTSLQELAIGGAFLKDKTLLIQSLEGKVMWDGEEIVASINSDYQDSLIQAKYHQGAKMVKDGTVGPGVDVFLPMGVALTVNRWRNGLAAEISMCPVNDAVGGQCRGPVGVGSMY